jgi:hypothetical protein
VMMTDKYASRADICERVVSLGYIYAQEERMGRCGVGVFPMSRG